MIRSKPVFSKIEAKSQKAKEDEEEPDRLKSVNFNTPSMKEICTNLAKNQHLKLSSDEIFQACSEEC